MGVSDIWQKFYKTLASIKTGVILLIIVVVFSAIGTFVLQRPTAEPGQIERAYTPSTLRVLDSLGLTDIFHAWYFLTLLALVSLSIIFVSIDRFPNAWRFYARPYRRTEPHFRAVLPQHTEIPIRNAKDGIEAAERGFRNVGLRTERIVEHDEVSLYSERNRFAVMAVYIIHASLLLIFVGGIIDGLFGYRGYMAIDEGSSNNVIEQHIGGRDVTKRLPFSVRCDSAGQENYIENGRDTGMPKRYWSKLTIVDKGRDAKSKEIVVNDPLVYRGVRLFQSSMGKTGKLTKAALLVSIGTGDPQKFIVVPNQPAQIAPDTTVRISRFVPDYYVQEGDVFTKSESPNNPALELTVNKAGQEHPVWMFLERGTSVTDDKTGYVFTLDGARLGTFTGLQVSFEPGHYFVWTGCVLMLAGLVVAFYLIHMRFWAVAVHDEKKGLVLWVGGACNKNKERFEERFKELVEAIQKELRIRESGPPIGNQKKEKEPARETTTVGA
jgi:cytochrome c biogenesis protein